MKVTETVSKEEVPLEEAPLSTPFGEDITPPDSIVPVYLVPLTEKELAEREQWAIEAAEREAADKAKVSAKESALAKLAKLGLTEEEAKAVIGL
jgi:hypothetical protein